jgi:uncharacterized protein
MRERLEQELKAAMFAKDQDRLLVLRSLKSEIKYREVEVKRPLTPEETAAIFKKAVKSREQAIELYIQGNRPELADKERREIAVVQEFIPPEMGEAEIDALVDQAIAEVKPSGMKDMGLVMKKAMEAAEGQADGKAVSAAVRRKLAG